MASEETPAKDNIDDASAGSLEYCRQHFVGRRIVLLKPGRLPGSANGYPARTIVRVVNAVRGAGQHRTRLILSPIGSEVRLRFKPMGDQLGEEFEFADGTIAGEGSDPAADLSDADALKSRALLPDTQASSEEYCQRHFVGRQLRFLLPTDGYPPGSIVRVVGTVPTLSGKRTRLILCPLDSDEPLRSKPMGDNAGYKFECVEDPSDTKSEIEPNAKRSRIASGDALASARLPPTMVPRPSMAPHLLP